MKARIISAAILLPICFLVIWVLPKAICAIAMAVLCSFMAYELLKRTELVPHTRLIVYTMLAAFLVPIWCHLGMSRPWGQLGLLVFFGTMVTHDYSMGKNVITVLGTIVGMVFIMFLAVLFTTLVGKIVGLITNIVDEIQYRL